MKAPLSPLDAAYHVVHDYEGGAPALAQRLAKPVATLNQELRPPPGCNAKLGLKTAVAISELTGDHRILFAFAQQLGYRCVRAEHLANITNGELLRAVSVFLKETGEAMTAVNQALEDGHITENEVRHFEKQVADIAPAAVALAERLRALADEQAKERAAPRGPEAS